MRRTVFSALLLCAGFSRAQEALEVVAAPGTWPSCKGNACDGAHRARVTVSDGAAGAACVHLEWRRRDLAPETKSIVVRWAADHSAAPLNRTVLSASRDAGEVYFDTSAHGAGQYDIYYLPFVTNGAAYGRKDAYLPMDRGPPAPVRRCNATAAAAAAAAVAAVSFEAQSSFDLFTRMEVAASAAELAAMHAALLPSGAPFALFPAARGDVIRSAAVVPQLWAVAPPAPQLSGTARRFEYWTGQLGLYALPATTAVRAVRVSFSALAAQGGSAAPPAAILLTCFNTEGRSQDGVARPVDGVAVDIAQKGRILPLWIGADVAADAAPGVYMGTVRVSASVSNATHTNVSWAADLPLALTVSAAAPLADRGDGDFYSLSKLRWLNGNDWHEGAIPAPFTPLTAAARKSANAGVVVEGLGRAIEVGAVGLPVRISTTTPGFAPRQVLSGGGASLALSWDNGGGGVSTATLNASSAANFSVTSANATDVSWSSQTEVSGGGGMVVTVSGTSAFDGYTEMVLEVDSSSSGSSSSSSSSAAETEQQLDDVQLRLPFAAETCRYMMGFNRSGAPVSSFDWRWDAGKPNNAFWVGHQQSGLRIRLKGPEAAWQQPRGPYFYHDLSRNATLPWGGSSGGGASFTVTTAAGSADGDSDGSTACELLVFTRTVTLPLRLHLDLVPTPSKPVTQATVDTHLRSRYFQNEATSTTSVADVAATGANINNLHQGTSLNPFMIYPFYPQCDAAFRNYSAEAAARSPPMVTKFYYSAGSFSFVAPELWALFSLGAEVIAPPAVPNPLVPEAGQPPLGPFHWLQEHALHPQYESDWTTPLAAPVDGIILDATITTRSSPSSRLGNFWVQALPLLVNETGTRGIYLDGMSYNRAMMLRAKRALDLAVPKGGGSGGGMMDLHCGNRWNGGKGEVNAVEYMGHMAFMDSLMFGEGFDMEGTSAAYQLVETSGLPFGIFNDMLNGGGNIYRGMLTGAVTRPPYDRQTKQDPGYATAMWAFFDSAGLVGSRFTGWWADLPDWRCPVRTNSSDTVKASVFARGGAEPRAVVVLASWADGAAAVELVVDWAALGLDAATARLTAPLIRGVQDAAAFAAPGDAITVHPASGIILVLQ